MWWPANIQRAVFACVSVLMLSACGFTPMYGKSQSTSASALGGVYVEPVAKNNRMAQQFKADLEDRLNPDGKVPANPAYRLSVTLASSETAIGVAKDGTISRYNVHLNSSYVLKDYKTEKPIVSGSLKHVSSYNNLTNAYFSTYVSKEDSIKRGITELAETFRQRLAPYLNGQRPPQKEEVVVDEAGV